MIIIIIYLTTFSNEYVTCSLGIVLVFLGADNIIGLNENIPGKNFG